MTVQVAVHVPSQTPVTYPIAVTSQSRQVTQANAFVQYALSPDGQAILQRYGFRKP